MIFDGRKPVNSEQLKSYILPIIYERETSSACENRNFTITSTPNSNSISKSPSSKSPKSKPPKSKSPFSKTFSYDDINPLNKGSSIVSTITSPIFKNEISTSVIPKSPLRKRNKLPLSNNLHLNPQISDGSTKLNNKKLSMTPISPYFDWSNFVEPDDILSDYEVGAGWYPIYISECSSRNSILFGNLITFL
jgi:hypothetical protein